MPNVNMYGYIYGVPTLQADDGAHDYRAAAEAAADFKRQRSKGKAEREKTQGDCNGDRSKSGEDGSGVVVEEDTDVI
ncbi:hypothetical protein ACFWXH_21145 [Mesorhizobium sp. NPDC059054]|uniref:hypothetical protein n=1 Tax=Mesorhizobium sp. NPDC059054 TaxID=3346711 RepID=UPI0036AEAC22